uniref:NADH-ubiquinone oxidoreductase chain 4L n=1 Tax=Paromalus flavicornis TaxID=154191 RepID=A0A0S2MPD9_9COLE|nr:NADH deshydrogenase subunit 4L [Paromalus flavicornis]
MVIFMLNFIYIAGIMSFSLKRKHLLTVLLSLEFIILGLYINLMHLLSFFSFEFYFSMIFLTISVCEGALGLSVLISLIRSHGNDYFSNFNILW